MVQNERLCAVYLILQHSHSIRRTSQSFKVLFAIVLEVFEAIQSKHIHSEQRMYKERLNGCFKWEILANYSHSVEDTKYKFKCWSKVCARNEIINCCFVPKCFKSWNPVCCVSGAYFCLSMVMITLSTVLACVVANMYFRGVRINEAPLWLKVVRYQSLMCVHCLFKMVLSLCQNDVMLHPCTKKRLLNKHPTNLTSTLLSESWRNNKQAGKQTAHPSSIN